MSGAGEATTARRVTYCIVPRDLSAKVYEPLREHFRDDPGIDVVIERRRSERRAAATRRSADRGGTGVPERRRIRSGSGRRVGERRAMTVPLESLSSLPKKARRYAAQLMFVERLEPASEQQIDADSKRLVTRHQAGEEPAFAELYLRYFNSVYTYARVAVGDHHEAEDVTQQVFIRVMSALDRYELRPHVPFRGWLFAIARNVIVDAIRDRHALVVESPEQVDWLRHDDAVSADVAQTLGWLSDREIAMFVERLPLAQRQVLVLRFMLDLSGEEIAQVLGRSHIAVRALQSRALTALAARLEAIGRTSARHGPSRMKARTKPLTVLARRRWALGVKAPRVPI